VLAYVFWHAPLDGAGREAYEHANVAFHRSLAHRPPVGLRGSACLRVTRPAWLGDGEPQPYEDWYLLEDFTALGVLSEAAVGRGHRSAHDAVARLFGGGAGALYTLSEGDGAQALAGSALAVWIARPLGGERKRGLDELLGDGMDPRRASLWRRQLVLGPGPEFCILADEIPAGVAPTRLPERWSATVLSREPVWSSG